jgi:hypothetical protein
MAITLDEAGFLTAVLFLKIERKIAAEKIERTGKNKARSGLQKVGRSKQNRQMGSKNQALQ